MDFEYLEHTADVKFRAYGSTWENVFRNAAKAMLEVMTDTSILKEEKEIRLKANASTLDELVVAWLSEILFQSETKEIIFKEAKPEKIWEENRKWYVKGTAIGQKMNKNMKFKTEIKAVTYHELEAKEKNGKKYCQVIVDI
ncbi:MAG: archease [Candidatus Diapherotrites archaeon]|nr:archease [Candidatus Diapherotrites archaeon]